MNFQGSTAVGWGMGAAGQRAWERNVQASQIAPQNRGSEMSARDQRKAASVAHDTKNRHRTYGRRIVSGSCLAGVLLLPDSTVNERLEILAGILFARGAEYDKPRPEGGQAALEMQCVFGRPHRLGSCQRPSF